ncbi:uncharacterized protein EI90DRAFT_61857 [Cantharellus anzutake]|uniref:uncharacterized protein n=1 Tax=Cantharellus anzutake TaxID=1750568 RepID=UPI0019046327|nr:uncharacterized protein EI90DRAFT_61857 [Cantharellus anzutake]KAF8344254.1 hypothetical protein EI90DRAFT_61857 [Cantharellus anzutake]
MLCNPFSTARKSLSPPPCRIKLGIACGVRAHLVRIVLMTFRHQKSSVFNFFLTILVVLLHCTGTQARSGPLGGNGPVDTNCTDSNGQAVKCSKGQLIWTIIGAVSGVIFSALVIWALVMRHRRSKANGSGKDPSLQQV